MWVICWLAQLDKIQPWSFRNSSSRVLSTSLGVAVRRWGEGGLQVGQWMNQSQFSTSRSLRGRMLIFQEQYWQKRVKGGGTIDMAALDDYQMLSGWQRGRQPMSCLLSCFG